MDINKIKEISKERRQIRKQAFKFILEMCHNKINSLAYTGTTNCWFELPSLIFGYPKYSMDECSEYLIKKLKKDGFVVDLIKQNYLQWNGKIQQMITVYTLNINWKSD